MAAVACEAGQLLGVDAPTMSTNDATGKAKAEAAALQAPSVEGGEAFSEVTIDDEVAGESASLRAYFTERIDKIHTMRDRLSRRLHSVDSPEEMATIKDKMLTVDDILDKLAPLRLVKEVRCWLRAHPMLTLITSRARRVRCSGGLLSVRQPPHPPFAVVV